MKTINEISSLSEFCIDSIIRNAVFPNICDLPKELYDILETNRKVYNQNIIRKKQNIIDYNLKKMQNKYSDYFTETFRFYPVYIIKKFDENNSELYEYEIQSNNIDSIVYINLFDELNIPNLLEIWIDERLLRKTMIFDETIVLSGKQDLRTIKFITKMKYLDITFGYYNSIGYRELLKKYKDCHTLNYKYGYGYIINIRKEYNDYQLRGIKNNIDSYITHSAASDIFMMYAIYRDWFKHHKYRYKRNNKNIKIIRH